MTSCNDDSARGPDNKTLGEWFIQQIAENAKDSGGAHLIDYFDTHFYPSANGVGSDADDLMTRILRLRAPWSLLDSGYVDESWIDTRVSMLPTMQQYIDAANASSWLQISIGEHAWGDDWLISTAVTEAEVLGIFGQFGVAMAMRWEAPRPQSAVEFVYKLLLGTNMIGERVQPTAPFLGQVVGVDISPSLNSQHVRVFASRRSLPTLGSGDGSTIVQLLLLCKYPIAGAFCSVELTVSPLTWGMGDCSDHSMVMSGIEPCTTGSGGVAKCSGSGFNARANSSMASPRRQLSGSLMIRHVVPSLSVHLLQLRCEV